jgi:uncharacterized protein (DUF433 family)
VQAYPYLQPEDIDKALRYEDETVELARWLGVGSGF